MGDCKQNHSFFCIDKRIVICYNYTNKTFEVIDMKKILVIGLSGESVFLEVEHFNNKGETVEALKKTTEPGGKGYNQALALGKLGADISFITVLGNDQYSNECISVLKKGNVKPYIIYKDVPSSYAVITVDKKGENNVIVYKGASDCVNYEDIMTYKDIIAEADILLLQLEYPQEVIKKIISYAYELNKTIILNPAPQNYLDNETLKKVNIITPNEFELSLIDINKIPETEIICTIGEKGVKYITEKGEILYSAYNVKAIDTTGAGDTFNAGLTYMLAKDEDISKCIMFANACSALEVTRKGVINAIPNYDEVINFMKGYNK